MAPLLPEITSMFVALATVASLLPIAAGVGGAYQLARAHQRVVERVQLSLDQILDRLEHRAVAPPRTGLLEEVVGNVVARATEHVQRMQDASRKWPPGGPTR
jgi:hypothetical protein